MFSAHARLIYCLIIFCAISIINIKIYNKKLIHSLIINVWNVHLKEKIVIDEDGGVLIPNVISCLISLKGFLFAYC